MTSDRNEWNRFRKDNTRAGPVAPYSDGRRIRAAMFRAAMPRLSCGRIERSFRREKKQRYFVRLNRSLQFLIIESILMLILPDKKIHIFERKELKIKVKNVFSIFFEMFEQSSKRHEERNLFFLPRERERKKGKGADL